MAEQRHFPTQPRNAWHLFAVARFDGLHEGGDPIDSFTLTRGYWDEADAQKQAERLNCFAPEDTRYFVLLARVSDENSSSNPPSSS